jgi:hypothetical protein
MAFTQEALERLRTEHGKVEEKRRELLQTFIGQRFTTERARDFAVHGFLRRVNMLARCCGNIFTLLPPDRRDLPSDEDRHDAEINLHAFVANVFGATDNLAWIWVVDKTVRKANGAELSPTQVGLRPGNEVVRASLTTPYLEVLREHDRWFAYLETLRHALAHRIPSYIPPFVITEANADKYEEARRQQQAALLRGDLAEHGRLRNEIEAMVSFQPWLQSAGEEGIKPIIFHAQLLADFMTIHQLGLKLLEQLNAE